MYVYVDECMSKSTQQAALQGYLDALLNDDEPALTPAFEPEPQRAPERQPALAGTAVKHLVLLDKPKLTFTLPAVAEPEPLISEETISRLPVSTLRSAESEAQAALEQASEVVAAEVLGQVDWSQEAFECLLFDVAGLTLAVPLAALGSIYAFKDADLTPLFGQPDWFIGLLQTPQGHLKVLETARWVMPERYTEGMRNDLNYVISINGFDWGLAVNRVRHAIRLEPEQVKWRTQRSQRAWLAGTVIEHMCALLDVQVLAQLITAPDRPSGIE